MIIIILVMMIMILLLLLMMMMMMMMMMMTIRRRKRRRRMTICMGNFATHLGIFATSIWHFCYRCQFCYPGWHLSGLKRQFCYQNGHFATSVFAGYPTCRSHVISNVSMRDCRQPDGQTDT